MTNELEKKEELKKAPKKITLGFYSFRRVY